MHTTPEQYKQYLRVHEIQLLKNVWQNDAPDVS